MDKIFECKEYMSEKNTCSEIISGVIQILDGTSEVLFTYLFGSFAEKRMFRDVDLAIFVNTEKIHDIEKFVADLSSSIQRVCPFPVDVRLLNNAPLAFCYSVIKNGILLLDRDENSRVDFETRTWSEYFDFLPLREEYLRESLTSEA